MAEDLTEYLRDHGVQVRYLHSDIETVERTEIIRDLRLGAFDVLVGINLLREGLDMPEVSLVAIFDADKEGFLRSERALIQTIGRAARHIKGRAILYADKTTRSIEAAIAETDRRRSKQIAYNIAHKIEPKTIEKPVQEIMEGARLTPKKTKNNTQLKNHISSQIDPKKALIKIKNLEKQMKKHARDLEFEAAANHRDQINELKRYVFGFSHEK